MSSRAAPTEPGREHRQVPLEHGEFTTAAQIRPGYAPTLSCPVALAGTLEQFIEFMEV